MISHLYKEVTMFGRDELRTVNYVYAQAGDDFVEVRCGCMPAPASSASVSPPSAASGRLCASLVATSRLA
jgi:hypothetical protein